MATTVKAALLTPAAATPPPAPPVPKQTRVMALSSNTVDGHPA
ncbi:hypothetical protein NHF46_00065 [Arthrobacter alpinus]|nr:hypothetical protein [Arthrobacter alpinus]